MNYSNTDIAFITLILCKLHKIYMSYLCIFADVTYISMRIEIFLSDFRRFCSADVTYISMRIEITLRTLNQCHIKIWLA